MPTALTRILITYDELVLFIAELVLSLTAQSLQHNLVLLIWSKSNMAGKCSHTEFQFMQALKRLIEKRRTLGIITYYSKIKINLF